MDVTPCRRNSTSRSMGLDWLWEPNKALVEVFLSKKGVGEGVKLSTKQLNSVDV